MSGGAFLLYGATGYSGALIAQTARQRGLPAILAGRDAAKVTALAERLGLEGRVARLDQPERLDDALRDVAVVVNAAGPLALTAAPLLDACLRRGAHYLDIGGELAVFEHLLARDSEARARGVMVMPGVGINVVASDCLAAHVMARLPAAKRLRIGISRTFQISRGSFQTVSTLMSDQVAVWRDGRLTRIPLGALEHDFDYGRGSSTSTAIGWPDVLTAARTTGAAVVEAFVQIEPLERALLPLVRASARMWSGALGQALVRADAWLLPDGPSHGDQRTRRRAIVVEAEDGAGRRVRARLRTPEGYWFTALSCLAVARRALAEEVRPGFQTPAGVYGPDLVLALDDVQREDLDG